MFQCPLPHTYSDDDVQCLNKALTDDPGMCRIRSRLDDKRTTKKPAQQALVSSEISKRDKRTISPAPHRATEKAPRDQSPRSFPVAPAAPRYPSKVRRSTSQKVIQHQRLTRTVLNPRSREVWRETGQEREFRASAGAAQCGGLRANPAVIGNFSPVKSSGETCSAKDWRRGWDSNPRYGFPYTRFPSVRLQPLGHLSSAVNVMEAQAAIIKSKPEQLLN